MDEVFKQLEELTPEDFTAYPIWEYALDTEGDPGHDETTMRACSINDFHFGSWYVCRATFITASGQEFSGFLSPGEAPESLSPSVFRDGSALSIAFEGKEERDKVIGLLSAFFESDADDIFPLRWFTPDLPNGNTSSGVIGKDQVTGASVCPIRPSKPARATKRQSKKRKLTCPCCGYMTLSKAISKMPVCSICRWQCLPGETLWADDDQTNFSSLRQAQKNFAEYGAASEYVKGHRRAPGKDDIRDPDWRPIEAGDTFMEDFSKEKMESIRKQIDWDDYESHCYWKVGYLLKNSV